MVKKNRLYHKKGYLLVIIISSLLFCHLSLWGYSWPVKEFNKQHTINATLGEPRLDKKGEPPTRFHSGVDIGSPDGTSVYSIDSGEVTYINPKNGEPKINEGIKVKNKAYIHLQKRIKKKDKNKNPYVTGIDNSTGAPPDKIGEVYKGTGHVHLTESGGASNPLRTPDGLSPFVDNVWPEVWDIKVFRDTTAGGKDDETGDKKQELVGSMIYGKIDLRAQAKDFRTDANGNPAGGNVSIYQITYQAVDANKITRVEPDYDSIKFDYKPHKSLIDVIYDISLSNMNTFYYWVTNSMTEDRYWNTKLHHSTTTWNGLEAKINGEAKCPDGEYKISVMAKDIRENGGDVEKQKGAETIERIIDNFIPYVQQVIITQDGGEKYNAHWSTAPVSSTDLGELVKENDTQFQSGKIEIELLFSEPMKQTIPLHISIQFSSGITKLPTTTGSWINDTTWKITTEDDFIPDDESGEAIVIIENAQDLSGNILDGDPQTIAARKTTDQSQWERAEAVADKKHKINVLKLNDWPMIDHDPGHTRYNPDATLEPPFTLKWSINGLSNPVPVISRGILYYTDLVDSIPKEIKAIDAITGELKWSQIVGTGTLEEISIANGTLYVGSYDGYMYALNAETGNIKWSQHCFPRSPVIVVDNAIYFSSFDDGKVYKIDANSGDISSGWQYQIPLIDPMTGVPTYVDVGVRLEAVTDGVVYVRYGHSWDDFPFISPPSPVISKANKIKNRIIMPSFENGIAAFDAYAGSYKWHEVMQDSHHFLAINKGIVYIYNKFINYYISGIEALGAGGNSLWSYVMDSPKRLSVVQDMVYANYYALDANNGSLIWYYPDGVGNVECTAATNDAVCILTSDYVYIVNAETGALQWSYPINGGKKLAIANDMVYVATDNSLYCFGSSDPKSPAPAIDSAFTLGEVYSYPNPAKRRNPTIHVEVGVADKVELNIYDVAGELIHSTELTDMLEVIDSKYAYEYTWNISNIASGVYLYHVQASKNGEGDIIILKKLAIIK